MIERRREWIGLAVIALTCLLYSIDLTVLELAMQKLSVHLRPTSGLPWARTGSIRSRIPYSAGRVDVEFSEVCDLWSMMGRGDNKEGVHCTMCAKEPSRGV